jgi:hypothetical protein
MTERIARLLADEVADAGTTEVRLLGTAKRPHPLADWRGLTVPEGIDQSFAVVSGDPGRPESVTAALATVGERFHPALRAGDILVFPRLAPWETMLRTVQFPPCAPVMFGLLDGADTAFFPSVPGWSAQDTARRAVAEHRRWLGDRGADRIRSRFAGGRPERAISILFSAARAALFLESLQGGDPALPLTAEATVELLEARGAGGVARSALARLEATEPAPEVEGSLARLVRELPAYAPVVA